MDFVAEYANLWKTKEKKCVQIALSLPLFEDNPSLILRSNYFAFGLKLVIF